MSILAYLLQIQYWFPSKDKKIYGFKILFFNFIGFIFEFGKKVKNVEHIHISLTIWKVMFTYQITIDWRD